MSSKFSLRDRMTGYELVSKSTLTKRVPVVIRIDGKAFHTFTNGLNKPFDSIIEGAMLDTMKYLCENVQNCVIGYTQSDEISLVLCDYEKVTTSSWFDYEIQKICSVVASMTTLAFNKAFESQIRKKSSSEYVNIALYESKLDMGALFDARVINVPLFEVNNYMIYRQKDATRNSVQGLAQSLYSQSEISGINTLSLQDKMFTEKGVNWNELTTYQKRGLCCIKVPKAIEKNGCVITRNKWEIDYNTPIFTNDTSYVNSRIKV